MEIYEFDVELQGLDDDPAGDAAVEAAATECLGECETGCDDGCSHDCGALPDAEREQRPTCLEDCLGECALDCEEGCGDHLYDPDAEAGALAGAEYLGHYQLVATQSGIR